MTQPGFQPSDAAQYLTIQVNRVFHLLVPAIALLFGLTGWIARRSHDRFANWWFGPGCSSLSP